MLSPKPEESIAWYRPVRYMRTFLSFDIWVPFANLTYAFYLFHLTPVLDTMGPVAYKIMKGDMVIDEASLNLSSPCPFSPGETTAIWLILAGMTFVITCIICVIVFVFVEKQGINARIAIKSKWTKADEIKKPIEAKTEKT